MTSVLRAPVAGSLAGAIALTVTAHQSSPAPAKFLATRRSSSPTLMPPIGPASSTFTVLSGATRRAVSGGSPTGRVEAPVNVASASTSNVCDATPGVAVLESSIPAGITSGCVASPGVRTTATWPLAAIPGAG